MDGGGIMAVTEQHCTILFNSDRVQSLQQVCSCRSFLLPYARVAFLECYNLWVRYIDVVCAFLSFADCAVAM